MADDDDAATTKQSIGDMAQNGHLDEGDTELFPLGSIDGDPNVTLKTLVRAGHRVTSTVSLQSAEVPAPKGGLLNPDKESMVLVTAEVAHYVPVPEREGDRHTGKKIVGWKVRQVLRPVHVERVYGEAGAIAAQFQQLLDADESEAGKLLDDLRERLTKKLADGKHPSRVPA